MNITYTKTRPANVLDDTHYSSAEEMHSRIDENLLTSDESETETCVRYKLRSQTSRQTSSAKIISPSSVDSSEKNSSPQPGPSKGIIQISKATVDTKPEVKLTPLPDFTEETLRAKVEIEPIDVTNFKFKCKTAKNRAFELEMAQSLQDMRKKYVVLKQKIRMDAERNLLRATSPQFLNLRLKDLVAEAGHPNVPNGLIGLLKNLSSKYEDDHNNKLLEPNDANNNFADLANGFAEEPTPAPSFPSPTVMLKNSGTSVFHFHGVPSSIGSSVSKKPRVVNAGEVLFSAKGSPVLQRRVPVSESTTRPKETVEIVSENGKRVRIDLVMVDGGPEETNFFKEFATDVRGVATVKSLSKTRRVPRLPCPPRKK